MQTGILYLQHGGVQGIMFYFDTAACGAKRLGRTDYQKQLASAKKKGIILQKQEAWGQLRSVEEVTEEGNKVWLVTEALLLPLEGEKRWDPHELQGCRSRGAGRVPSSRHPLTTFPGQALREGAVLLPGTVAASAWWLCPQELGVW